MTHETLLALIGFAVAASITPGPNNMMVFASTVNFGFLRTLPHMAGVVAGFVLLMAAVGGGLGAVITAFPALLLVAKVAGALYLLWIAWKIGTTRKFASTGEASGRPLSFLQAVAFQWVNPKAWIMSLTAMSVYTDPGNYVFSVALVAGIFGLVTIPSISVWGGFGSGLRDWLSHGNRLKWFNIAMAVVLVASLWPMLR
ncbi:LysE family translocator [Martelella endophytica]|uniref:Lysine transporter LysE n=1 Tax=Martelella endophytica TaxID=1486262 RepID=A0A0D5LRW3_MAREN|nr:LysE family translocator [Martelella endophytica]AJY46705.1 lysine transporter LysE [Martelella endophytica]